MLMDTSLALYVLQLLKSREGAAVFCVSPKVGHEAPFCNGEEGEDCEEAFDAATFANRFRYGEFGDAVVFTEARRSAVLSKKPRILKWSMTKTGKNSKTPLLVVHYISEMYGQRRPFEDQVPLWSLRQMVDFSHALGSTGTRRTRSSASVPSADAVSARCPPLWWSLALWAFAEFARGSSGKGKGAKWPPESPAEPVSIPGDFPKLLYTVLHGGAQGQSERQVKEALTSILREQ
ncbi:unnamed protein product [Durusdinium trenchii]|uniref:Uncharacterized protein n=1 Tax=Durusdinium trenchii TaxID=1381693 RepID=A0ABP0HGT5_9DINO